MHPCMVLVECDESGNERPIAYMSHKLNGAQRNYTVTELECLAVLLAIRKCHRSWKEVGWSCAEWIAHILSSVGTNSLNSDLSILELPVAKPVL